MKRKRAKQKTVKSTVFMVEAVGFSPEANIPAFATEKQAFRRLRLKNELLLASQECSSHHPHRQKTKESHKGSLFFLVEVWRFELQASSTRSKKNAFFDYQTLHIARIFRKIVSFFTPVPLFTCRKILVVVSYVVKLF